MTFLVVAWISFFAGASESRPFSDAGAGCAVAITDVVAVSGATAVSDMVGYPDYRGGRCVPLVDQGLEALYSQMPEPACRARDSLCMWVEEDFR